MDTGSVASGSDGITETGVLTRGEGFVDVDQDEETNEKEEGTTMQSILRSKGLAGVFDHDVVESNRPSQSLSVREMEENARKVATAAVRALKDSVAGHDRFTPTWTGTETSQGGRFGENRSGGTVSVSGKASPGIGWSTSNATPFVSSSLLASIRERNEGVANEAGDGFLKSSTKENTALLERIRTFVRRREPTTDEILREFSSVKSYDAAIFRRLLKSVAAINDGGRWHLKKRP